MKMTNQCAIAKAPKEVPSGEAGVAADADVEAVPQRLDAADALGVELDLGNDSIDPGQYWDHFLADFGGSFGPLFNTGYKRAHKPAKNV